jgi:hypothetical protein
MMKIRKYITAFVIAIVAVTMVSCNKKVDVLAVQKLLPPVELSSIGMSTEGPYPTTSTVQILFGATTTNETPGTFDLNIYDAAAPAVVVETIHFNSWNGFDSTTPAGATVGTLGSISTVQVPTSYPNTIAYQGSILIKLNKLTSGKTYNVTATAKAADATVKPISLTVKSLFFIQ